MTLFSFVRQTDEGTASISVREMSIVEDYVKASDFRETHKISDIDVGLIREIIK